MLRHMRYLVLSCGLFLATFPFHSMASDEPRYFRAGSLKDIQDGRRGQGFLLNIWSLSCPPCRGELDTLAKIRQKYPDLPLVLISTDGANRGREIQSLLREKGLSNAESWVFAEADAQRLRFEIDAKWYGEMPRSYFYDAAHQRRAISGVLKPTQLEAWAQSIQR